MFTRLGGGEACRSAIETLLLPCKSVVTSNGERRSRCFCSPSSIADRFDLARKQNACANMPGLVVIMPTLARILLQRQYQQCEEFEGVASLLEAEGAQELVLFQLAERRSNTKL